VNIRIRLAQTVDLPRIAEIWAASQGDGAATGVPSLYDHECANQELFVAERSGVLLGFASVVVRGSVAFLADLFVDPACQSEGVGRRLLHHVLPVDRRLCCTLSSGDPRALGLYIRAGMRPYWPCYQLRARLPHLHDLDSDTMKFVEAATDDPELVRWDEAISGRLRPQDLAYWVQRREPSRCGSSSTTAAWDTVTHRRTATILFVSPRR
jgi:GNAT superfamily N-acetyltransferase